jgi:conjugative transfer signal peptidase TraF
MASRGTQLAKRVHRDRPFVGRRLRFSLSTLLIFIAVASIFGNRQIIINTSGSVVPGVYLRSSDEPSVGKLVDFCIPLAARPYVFERTGSSGENWYILKPIAAGPGDRVSTIGSSLMINGHTIAPMPPKLDSAGRPLPLWRDDRTLGTDEFFVFSGRIPNSFDSRCYGPLRREQIATVRRPLITW